MPSPTSLPLYVQISEMLIRDIQAGRVLDGERLPPERDMAQGLGISVGTLRKALDDLSAKGLLDRRHGSGNYIRAGAEPVGVYAFFRLELIGGGGLPTAEVLSVDRLPKPEDLPAFGTSTEGHRIRRLRRLGGKPAAYEEIWLDGSRATTLRKDQLSESLYAFYKARLGLWIARAEDRIGVGEMPGWGTGLALTAGAPCGHIERVSWDQTGASCEASRTWFDAGVATYVSRIK
ncbi:GntR family transcriptional regulator [Anianabacter salinae]|uniref:GntR family transcriptional regulator n=1 Tax=Anianabacter salinae TaxID=2851023 RepID=UPI00225DF801|nr:GntR family transcriptional regulator [Anianabacter salinae]MBV0912380.1 GntR family transcriptional regulator [Anianabacter salinae]